MSLPNCALINLDFHNVSYEVLEAELDEKIAQLRSLNDNSEQVALMIVLEAQDQRVQAIIGSNSILNMDALHADIPPLVNPLDEEQLTRLLNESGLDELPAIPAITGYKTFVDNNLLEAQTVFTSSGRRGSLISMPQEAFKTLLTDSQTLELGISIYDLPAPLNSQKQDNKDIYEAIRKYTSLQIKNRLHDTLEIPPLSVTAQKILNLSANPNADIEDLVEIVERDPSLAAQVVGWAASPYYSAPGKVKSIHDAIVRVLGYDLVLNLALGLAMGQSLKVPQKGACAVSNFWRQSIYCALTMEKINRMLPPDKRGQPGFTYLIGLMNNFGYLILNHVFPAHFKTLCQYMKANPHINPMHIERHLLGITSEQMCAQLAETWNLPSPIKNALRFKQDLYFDGPDANYANLCFLSTRLLARIGIGTLPKENIPGSLYQTLGLSRDKINQTVEELMASQNEIEIMLSGLAA